MKIVFFGNTRFSVISLDQLNSRFPVFSVVTLPDQVIGRKKTLTPNPIKQFALNHNIQILGTGKLTDEIISKIKELSPDFIVVADYGLILPQKLLNLPKFAPLNIHHSLLPKYRGPAPVPFAILEGEEITGVTIIKMTDKVDAGDILAQKNYSLLPHDTTETVLIELNKLGGELAGAVIEKFLKNNLKPIRQDENKATYTKRFTKEDGYFEIDNPPSSQMFDRMVRAYYPWPTVWTKWDGKVVKFLPSSSHPERSEGSKFLVQIEGKKPVTLKDFLNGYSDFPLKDKLW